MAEQSAAEIQRAYLAAAITARFDGFADVEYPDWHSLLDRLRAESAQHAWRGPIVIDELPYLIASDASLASILQHWVDNGEDCPCLVVSVYALWGGIPKYWELAEGFGEQLDAAIDWLVLDPSGPLHQEPERLLREELPPAMHLRPLLDIIGNGAHRLSEIAGRLGKPASSLSRPLIHLQEMGFLQREVPFGSSPLSSKRSLYRVDDPFLRLWFRVVAPHRAALAQATRDRRLAIWQRYRVSLEAEAWESLCRQALPRLISSKVNLENLGPWEPAQRFWQGRLPEVDLVARSVDGGKLLVGEAKLSSQIQRHARNLSVKDVSHLPEVAGKEIVRALFVPENETGNSECDGVHVVDAGIILRSLRDY